MTDPDSSSQPKAQPSSGPLQPPRGTRDFYPEDFARRKYVFDAWRSASLRHGFDEIDGPTFEHLDLYTRKSGEGIVSELFSFKRFGGETDFALRPEFTPTLARMVATKANALPKPIKWFSIGNYFRAERPQRGRLREFVQWNCDILGDPSPEADAECIACCVEALKTLGLGAQDVVLRINDRRLSQGLAERIGVPSTKMEAWFAYLDGESKRTPEENSKFLESKGIDASTPRILNQTIEAAQAAQGDRSKFEKILGIDSAIIAAQFELRSLLHEQGTAEWCQLLSASVVRGLAYYTGFVFEVHTRSGAERAIAGGGRYDNLVELFGGPPTPAVGFAMGDVVLSLVLEDKGLLPSGPELRRRIGAAPDVFVISNGAADSDAQLQPLLASLRRAGLHARRSYKSTKNVGKLLKDAADSGARTAAIIESAGAITLKDLASPGAQRTVTPAELPAAVRALTSPAG